MTTRRPNSRRRRHLPPGLGPAIISTLTIIAQALILANHLLANHGQGMIV